MTRLSLSRCWLLRASFVEFCSQNIYHLLSNLRLANSLFSICAMPLSARYDKSTIISFYTQTETHRWCFRQMFLVSAGTNTQTTFEQFLIVRRNIYFFMFISTPK